MRRKRKILEENGEGGPVRDRDGLQSNPAIFMFALTWTIGVNSVKPNWSIEYQSLGEHLLRIPKGGRKMATFLCFYDSHASFL